MAFTPDPSTWTVQFSDTQMAVSYPHHLTGEIRTDLFDLHREAPEGVFTSTPLTTVTAKNGREFAVGILRAAKGDAVTYVAWPLPEFVEELGPTYVIVHAVRAGDGWTRMEIRGVRESDVVDRQEALRWGGSTNVVAYPEAQVAPAGVCADPNCMCA